MNNNKISYVVMIYGKTDGKMNNINIIHSTFSNYDNAEMYFNNLAEGFCSGCGCVLALAQIVGDSLKCLKRVDSDDV